MITVVFENYTQRVAIRVKLPLSGVLLFIMSFNLLTMGEILIVTPIQVKLIQQYVSVVLFIMLHKVVLPFE